MAIGPATLARAEAFMLVGLLALPLAAVGAGLAGARAGPAGSRWRAGAALLVMAPWVVANLIRFEEPATLSTQMGPTLEAANCDDTYFGPAHRLLVARLLQRLRATAIRSVLDRQRPATTPSTTSTSTATGCRRC